MARLVPCAACARHVKSSDAACPFCGHTSAASAGAGGPTALSGRTRASLVAAAFVAAALAGGAAACDGETKVAPLPDDDAGRTQDSGSEAGSSGGADAGVDATDSGQAKDAPADVDKSDVAVQPPYGAPPLDSGSD